MDITYYKEQHHNYMVICKTEDDNAVGYQQKMLESQRMEYLLPSKARSIDGNEYNYYDITSKLTLRQMYGSRYLDMDDIRTLFHAIRASCEEVDRYLLDVRRICLDPNLIYYNCSGNRYSFLYNISTGVTESLAGIETFMDYLLDRVSPDDNEASDLIYRMYEQYEKCGADVWDAVLMAEACYDAEDVCDTDPHGTVSVSDPGTESDEGDSIYDSVYEGMGHMNGQDMAGLPVNETADPGPVSRIAPVIMAICGILGIAACAVTYLFVYLEDDEKLILIAGAAVSALMAVMGTVITICRRIRAAGIGSLHKKEEMPDDNGFITEYSSIPAVHMQEFISRPVPPVGRKPRVDCLNDGPGDDESGKTVFFDEKGSQDSYKLYALDRRNKQHIDLDHFPCTIGKLTGYVDHCIDHPSVSRLHARVEKIGNDLVLSDLNSTNGVFLNGIRLNPNEQRSIEVGDEIRFGSLNYCLRYRTADVS
ncbi:MAG: FHA domain-containing protein [Lachnospiraceae bacterium]|nr:FHA domain-containing protein [Lachnospiraceae bacterium]